MAITRRCGIVLGMLLLSLGGVIAGPHPSNVPNWPQQFALMANNHLAMGFPVTQPGAVTVTVNWKGVPLQVALVDQTGQVAASLDAQKAPTATLQYQVTAADVARARCWYVQLTSPKGKSRFNLKTNQPIPAAHGTVTVTSPAVDEASFQRVMASLRTQAQQAKTRFTQCKAAMTHQATQAKTGAKQPIPVPAKPHYAEHVASLKKMLLARFNARKPSTVKIPGSKPNTPANIKTKLTPTITEIVPPDAMPGDQVAVTVESVAANSIDRVIFTLPNNKLFKLYPTSRQDNGDGTVTVQVTTPRPKDDTVAATAQVTVSCTQPAFTTPAVPFQFDAVPLPGIIAFSPGCTGIFPGVKMSMRCRNLQPQACVHFLTPANKDVKVMPDSQDDKQQLVVTVPSYAIADWGTLQFWVANSNGDAGTPLSLTVPPNQTELTSVDRPSGSAGEPVLLDGYRFTKPTVAFQADPQQDPGVICLKNYFNFTVERVSDIQVLASIPADAGGFTGPLHGKIIVNDLGDQVSIPYTLMPLQVIVPLMPTNVTNFYIAGNPDDYWECLNYQDNGTNHWVAAMHGSDIFTGHSGIDHYEANVVLKNGWVLDHGEAAADSSSDSGTGAYCDSVATNTSGQCPAYPYINVRWWADAPTRIISYQATIYVRGYQGVPFSDTNNNNW